MHYPESCSDLNDHIARIDDDFVAGGRDGLRRPVGRVVPVAGNRAGPGDRVGGVHGERGPGAGDGAKGIGHDYAELRAGIGQRHRRGHVTARVRARDVPAAVPLPPVGERWRAARHHAEPRARPLNDRPVLRRTHGDRSGTEIRGQSVIAGGVERAVAGGITIDAHVVIARRNGVMRDGFRRTHVAIRALDVIRVRPEKLEVVVALRWHCEVEGQRAGFGHVHLEPVHVIRRADARVDGLAEIQV